jgi:tetratricopeptide (TPR) repeat protein
MRSDAMNRFLLYIWLLVFITGCTTHQVAVEEGTIAVDQAERSCSYYYFLKGTHAEYEQHFEDALAAYEKALICDEQADYVREKIPLLMLKMGEVAQAEEWLLQAISDRPDDITYMLFLANLYVQQDKIAEATDLYQQLLEKEPDNEAVNIRLALLYSHQEDYQTAEDIYRKLLKRDQQSYFTRLSLARLLKQQLRFIEAEAEYEKALSLNWSEDLAYEMAFLYVNSERYEDALRMYTTISKRNPVDETAALNRVQTLIDLERHDEALAALITARHYSSNPQQIDLIVAKILLHQQKQEEAKEILLSLLSGEDGSEARYLLALLSFQNKNYQKSEEYLRLIEPGSRQFEEAVYLRTRLYNAENQGEKAVRLLERYLADPETAAPLFYALLSVEYQNRGDNGGALKLMKKAVSLYPKNHQLLFEYAMLLEKNGSHEAAIQEMEKLLLLAPDHAEALNFIGYSWADRNVNLEQALLYIEKALELTPNNGYIIDSLGWVYFRMGELEMAATTLQRSLELEPDDPHIYDHLGDVYRAQKEYDKALEVYRLAYEMFDDKNKRKAVKEKIEDLEK